MYRVYFFTPYSLQKNIGRAYNDYMEMIPNDEDWGCLLDGDTMFLTPDFGHQISYIVNKNSNVGLFTCITNRVGNADQCYQNTLSNESDIRRHRKIAQAIQYRDYDKLTQLHKPISGHMMLIKKSTWRKNPFSEGKILNIDRGFSKSLLEAGETIYLMNGVYLLHYYRLNEGRRDKSHLL